MSQRAPERLWAISRALFRRNHPLAARAVKTLNWAIHKCLLPAEAIVGDGVILEHHADSLSVGRYVLAFDLSEIDAAHHDATTGRPF